MGPNWVIPTAIYGVFWPITRHMWGSLPANCVSPNYKTIESSANSYVVCLLLVSAGRVTCSGSRKSELTLEKILRVCQAHVADPYAQRYHFWKAYAERYLA